jgi:hypothetical protein
VPEAPKCEEQLQVVRTDGTGVVAVTYDNFGFEGPAYDPSG